MSPLLEVNELQIAFGGVKAVNGLTFSADAGEIVSVIGPNGAGKTSAFNCITGFYKPVSGSVTLDSLDITGKRPAVIAATGVTRTFQNLRLFPDLTVLDNVRGGMHLYGGQNFVDALFHTPRYRKVNGTTRKRRTAGWILLVMRAAAASPCGTSPTASSERWKWRGPWPARPNWCSWMSPAPG